MEREPIKASDFEILRVMLQARIRSWEESLMSWEGMPVRGAHTEVIADRKARIDELKEILRLLPDFETLPSG